VTEKPEDKSNNASSSASGKDVKTQKKIPEIKSFKNSTALTPKERKEFNQSELSSPVFVDIRGTNPKSKKLDLHYDTEESLETKSVSPPDSTKEKPETTIISNNKDDSEDIADSDWKNTKPKKKQNKRVSISSSSSNEIEELDPKQKKTKPKIKQNKRVSISSSSNESEETDLKQKNTKPKKKHNKRLSSSSSWSSIEIPKRKKTVKKKKSIGRRKMKKTYSSSSDSESDIKPVVRNTKVKDYGPYIPVITKNGHCSLSYYNKKGIERDLPPAHKQPASAKRLPRPPDRYGTYI